MTWRWQLAIGNDDDSIIIYKHQTFLSFVADRKSKKNLLMKPHICTIDRARPNLGHINIIQNQMFWVKTLDSLQFNYHYGCKWIFNNSHLVGVVARRNIYFSTLDDSVQIVIEIGWWLASFHFIHFAFSVLFIELNFILDFFDFSHDPNEEVFFSSLQYKMKIETEKKHW